MGDNPLIIKKFSEISESFFMQLYTASRLVTVIKRVKEDSKKSRMKYLPEQGG